MTSYRENYLDVFIHLENKGKISFTTSETITYRLQLNSNKILINSNKIFCNLSFSNSVLEFIPRESVKIDHYDTIFTFTAHKSVR